MNNLYRILMPLSLMAMLLTGCVWQRTLEFVLERKVQEIKVGGWSIEPECQAYFKSTLKQIAGHENMFPLDISAEYARPDCGAYMNDLVIDSVRTRLGRCGDQIMWSVPSIGFGFRGGKEPILKLTRVERTDATTHPRQFEIPPDMDTVLIDFYVTVTPGQHALFNVPGYRDWLTDTVLVPEGAVGRQEVVTATLVRKESKSLFFGL